MIQNHENTNYFIRPYAKISINLCFLLWSNEIIGFSIQIHEKTNYFIIQCAKAYEKSCFCIKYNKKTIKPIDVYWFLLKSNEITNKTNKTNYWSSMKGGGRLVKIN